MITCWVQVGMKSFISVACPSQPAILLRLSHPSPGSMQGWTHAVRCRSSSASKVQLVHLVKAWMGEVVEEKTRGIEGGGWEGGEWREEGLRGRREEGERKKLWSTRGWTVGPRCRLSTTVPGTFIHICERLFHPLPTTHPPHSTVRPP